MIKFWLSLSNIFKVLPISTGKGWWMARPSFPEQVLTFTSTLEKAFNYVIWYASLLCCPGWLVSLPNGEWQSPQFSSKGRRTKGNPPETPSKKQESLAIMPQRSSLGISYWRRNCVSQFQWFRGQNLLCCLLLFSSEQSFCSLGKTGHVGQGG